MSTSLALEFVKKLEFFRPYYFFEIIDFIQPYIPKFVSYFLGHFSIGVIITFEIFRHLVKEDDGLTRSIANCTMISLMYFMRKYQYEKDQFGDVYNIGLVFISAYYLVKYYKRHIIGEKFVRVNLKDKVYIVTGSNIGIGNDLCK